MFLPDILVRIVVPLHDFKRRETSGDLELDNLTLDFRTRLATADRRDFIAALCCLSPTGYAKPALGSVTIRLPGVRVR